MKLLQTFLLASAPVVAAALPIASTLVDQTVAQAHAQSVAERYASAAVPKQQTAVEPTREEQYRRIQEDLQKWSPRHKPLEVTNRDFKIQWRDTSASRAR